MNLSTLRRLRQASGHLSNFGAWNCARHSIKGLKSSRRGKNMTRNWFATCLLSCALPVRALKLFL